jgi:hypothetical protein
MSSLFDTEVYQRRNHTPWASVNFLHFVRDMVWNGTAEPLENEVVFKARYRNDVASRVWYELSWTGEDGERHYADSQDFGLLLWRAAEIELKARAKKEKNDDSKGALSRGD